MLLQFYVSQQKTLAGFKQHSNYLLKAISLATLLLLAAGLTKAGTPVYKIKTDNAYNPLAGTGTIVSLGSYEVSDTLPIGFKFNFFGANYTQFRISSKGFITFSNDLESGCCPNQTIPYSSAPNNLIAFDWGNINPSNGGTISYFTTGTSPKRMLVVNFEDLPINMASKNSKQTINNSQNLTTQVVLHETSGLIELHSLNTPYEYQHTMGIENADGSDAYIVKGRNMNQWSSDNEHIQFIPLSFSASNDAGIAELSVNNAPACPGNTALQVSIQNYGINTINQVNINWSVNGVLQSPLTYNTALDSINSVNSGTQISLGDYNFSGNQTYTIKAWTESPNSLNDTIPYNDTSTLVYTPAMQGIYTIGGNNPNFASFTAAVHALNTAGVCGPVLFTVRSGVYNEQISIRNLLGSSETNTITFQSESGINTDVVLDFAASIDTANYTLQLINSDFITFKNMTLKSSGETYGIVIDLRNGADNNTFTGNLFEGIRSTDEYAATIIYSNEYNNLGISCNNLHFSENKFKFGAAGIYLRGNQGGSGESVAAKSFSSLPSANAYNYGMTGLEINNNDFLHQFSKGINLLQIDGGLIRSNTIHSDSSQNNFYGLRIESSYNQVRIEKNKINIPGGEGISMYNCTSNNGYADAGLIANNFIHCGGTERAIGINTEYCYYQKIANNSIHISSTDSLNGKAFNTYYCGNLIFQNNALSNTGKGLCTYVYSLYQSNFDYNNYYTNGIKLAYWNADVYTLAQLRTQSLQEIHTISVDPQFVSDSDLHSNSPFMNGKGKSLPEVTDDIDGDLRAVIPDIGADEYFASGIDASLNNFVSPTNMFKSGNNPIQVSLYNNGGTAITAAEIEWEVNGVAQTAFHWTGNLASGDTSIVSLGNYNFLIGTKYSLKARVHSPNGVQDLVSNNDTIQADSLYAALIGTYTIGGIAPDFATFTEANTALKIAGVMGAVHFMVRNGTYNEQIEISQIKGADATNTISFQSEANDSSTVVLLNSGDDDNKNYVVQLNGADFIAFNKISFEAQGTNYSKVINILNAACNNRFNNCVFKNATSTSSSTDNALINSSANYLNYNHGNKFFNNNFIGGSYGIYYYGYSNSYYNSDTGLVISNNRFNDQYYSAISVYNQYAAKITANNIVNSNNNSYYYGASLNYCNGGLIFTKNKINISGGGYGVYAQASSGESFAYSLFANNFISVSGNSNNAYGMYLNSCNYSNVFNNSISISNANNGGAAFYQYYCYNQKIINNIFYTQGNAYTINFGTSSVTGITEDHNNYYTTGNKLGYWNGDKADLSQWKTATGFDANSVSVDPAFPSVNNLHISKASLNNLGLSLAEIKDDIDGEIRQTTPDIGADEFNVIGENLALYVVIPPKAPFKAGIPQAVYARVRNSGQSNLTHFTINWKVNGVAQNTINWTGNLAVGAKDSILLGNYSFNAFTAHAIKAWAGSPNGTTDIAAEDDSSVVNNVYAALEGAYTIGGVNPDFTTISNAVQVLNTGGVLSAVTFNIRNGVYPEQLSIRQFPGSSCSTPVTFQSENKDSTAVLITYNATNTNNYIILLDGADGIVFNQLGIQASNNYYGRVIHLRNGANCNQFTSNVINGVPTNYNYGDIMAVIFSDNTRDAQNSFRSNKIKDGSYGVLFYGSSNAREGKNKFEYNTFENQQYRALYLQYQDSLIVASNKITTSSGNSYIGINVSYCSLNNEISKNRITAFNGGIGISSDNCNGQFNNKNIISNNFISINSTSSNTRGISIQSNNYLYLVNNSINITGTTAGSIAFSTNSSNYSTVYNNIFYNGAGGYAYYNFYSQYQFFSNRNNLFTTGSKLALYNSVDKTNLADWKQASKLDSNSVSVNPAYSSFSDLHTKQVNLNANAKPFSFIQTDIDGELRDLNHPDIGADEFVPLQTDAGVYALLTPKMPFLKGSNPVKIYLKNLGSDTLKNVIIDWSVNGDQQTRTNWNGLLTAGDTVQVNLGDYLFNAGILYTIKTWTSLPNGTTDLSFANDTLTVDSLYPALIGTYTIGGAAPDFQNFTAANTALNLGGIAGKVIFKVRNGTYNEQISIPVIKGTTATSPIVFESESGDSTKVILNFSSNSYSNNYIVQLNGADFVSFNKITIAALNNSYSRVIDIKNGSDFANITNCILQGKLVNTSSDYNAIVYTSGSADRNTCISNNKLINGSAGIYMYGYSASAYRKNIKIENNQFENQYYYGVYAYYQDSLSLLNNTFISNTQSSEYYNGISCQSCNTHLSISKNKLSLGNGGYGLYLYNSYGSAQSIISNNFIHVAGSNTSYGMYLYYSGDQNIFNNSINITGTSIAAGRGIYFGYSNYRLNVKNNIFANTGGGYALYSDNAAAYGSSDYNDIYTSGSKVAYWAGDKTTLADLKLANSMELHSISQNPLYVSASNLHAREITLDKAGIPLAEVQTDIDGETRDQNHPDIGADEFKAAAAADAGIVAISFPQTPFAPGNLNVYVKLRNYGADTLKIVKINWKVNGVQQTTFNWTGKLAQATSDSVNIGVYHFLPAPAYSITAWPEMPNGIKDTLNYNDTSSVHDLYAALNGVYTIGGATPDFNSFNAAATRLLKAGVAGPVTFNVRQGTYKEHVSLTAIPGVSALQAVVFTSENGDSTKTILKDSLSSYTIELDGADYVSFKRLGILNTYPYGSYTVSLKNGVEHAGFYNNIIEGSGNAGSIVYCSGKGNHNNSFINNRISNGNYGIALYGEYNNYQTGSRIENNTFNNQYYAGLMLQYQEDIHILQNSINLSSTNVNVYGCRLYSCRNTIEFAKNKINLINDGYGLMMDNCTATLPNSCTIANNFISVGGTVNGFGITINYSANFNLYNNNINVKNNANTSCAISLNGASNCNLINNIFSNYGNGSAISQTYTGSNFVSDYNDIFTKGTVLAIFSNNSLNDLNAWKTATHTDAHSFSVDPLFQTATNLHIAQALLNGAATPLTQITTDIDGEPRNASTPDIGADEFENNRHDIGITEILPSSSCSLGANEDVTVSVRNFGGVNESGFKVAFALDNGTVVEETINQNLAAGAVLKHTFATKVNLAALRNYNFVAYTLLGNDEVMANDSLYSNVSNMPKLTLKVSNDTSICPGRNIWLTAEGADNYTWNNGQKTNTISVSPSIKTTYIVNASNSFNCTASDTIVVGLYPAPPVPVVSPAGPISLCSRNTQTLSSSLNQHITWATGEKTASITVNRTGNYYVNYTDTNGCTASSANVVVTVENAPEIVPANLSICSNDSVSIKVNNALTYHWSTGVYTPSIKVKPQSSSTYTVNATTALGCTYNLSSTINLLPTQTPDQVSGLIPANGAIDLSLPLEVSWLPANNATQYDIYVWPADQAKPSTAFASNINSIRYKFTPNTLTYGLTYKWQVISKFHSCEATPGPVQTFMLRHLPDVVVNYVQIPTSAYTGQNIDITWEVKNQGLGNTVHQQWTDQLYLSIDTILDEFYSLGRVSNMTYLEPGESYLKKSSFTLPKYKDGLFNVFSWTDRDNALLEKVESNNQGRSPFALWVKLTPPPDLFVSNIVAPADVFSEDTVNLSWTVVNKGKWTTETNAWTDRVYISQDFDVAKRYFLGNFYHKADTLYPNKSYTTTHSVVLPQGITGRYYFYVETDAYNNVQEHAYDGNNVSQSDSVNVILRPPADLMVGNIVCPATATNIDLVNVKWKVRNIGNSSPNDKYWSDAIYLTQSPNYDLTNAYSFSFPRQKPTTGVPLGLVYNNSESIQIPHNIPPGNYYVYVKTDNNNQVFEYIYEKNNLLRSDTTIKISIAPWPDLSYSSLTYTDSIGAGESMRIQYTVTNKGTAMAAGTWEDKIYMSQDNFDCPYGALLKTIKITANLPVNGSYTVDTNVVIPSGFRYGSAKYCFSVHLDREDKIYEHSSEGNNDSTRRIFIKPSDLAITNAVLPNQVYSGSVLPISWTITDLASSASPAIFWRDKIELLDSNKVSITPSLENLYWKNGPVKAGASYNNQNNILVPDGIFGNYYIRLTTDLFNENVEKITSNNVRLIPIKIILREPSDLVIASFNPPPAATAGQPVNIQWSVQNKGTGATVANAWTDKVYLSQDTLIDPFTDILLGSFARNADLNAGATYLKNEQLFLPMNSVGNYYVIVQTDATSIWEPYGKEYEHKAEQNNSARSLMSISLSPPSDLVVTNITSPGNATAGEPFTLSWTIKNNGPNKAEGYMTDMVYFSKDGQWDIRDPFFGEKPVQIKLAPNQDTTFSLTTELTGTGVGNYTIIVRTDNKNNINESSDLNNTLAGTGSVNVEVAELPLYVLKTKKLLSNKGQYYRIEIPDSLKDETLLITLKGDSLKGNNELYISYDSVPDRSKYEYASGKPFAGNQEVIVPDIKKGRYYLLVYGTNASATDQDITLYAEIIHFQVRSVQANEGGNSGNITVEVNGAKFTNTMQLKLYKSGNAIQASNILYVNPTKVFATFNLDNAALGIYDVVATKPNGDSTSLKNGFKVTTKSPFGLVTSVKAPARMRINTIDIISVQFANDGNVDIPIPQFKLISEDGLPIALLRKDLVNGATVVPFECHEVNGPQTMLRPGAVGTLYIWVFATRTGLCHFKFE